MRNCTKIVSSWLHRLGTSQTETARRLFCDEITAWHTDAIQKLDKLGMSIVSLPLEQRRQLARTIIWCEEPWLSIIPKAAKAFETEFNKALAALPRPAVRTDVHVTYLPVDNSLWRASRSLRADGGAARINITIADFFLLDESGDVPRRLAKFLVGHCAQGRRPRKSEHEQRAFNQWMRSERVLEYVRTLEQHTSYSEYKAQGRTYDLAAMYTDVNREYFSNSLSQPELCWSRHQAYCRVGYYNSMKNSITISSALDFPEVPEYVVRFVLYHEMLHQEARLALMQDTKGKRSIHGADFRKAERKFTHYEEASAYLSALAKNRR
jgi:hypothetical protein